MYILDISKNRSLCVYKFNSMYNFFTICIKNILIQRFLKSKIVLKNYK